MATACPTSVGLYIVMVHMPTCRGNASAGEPDEHYIRAVKRYELAGVHVGEKYHTAQHPVQEFNG